ncbi:hypothetical protein D3C87_2096040 [compost metagenome]
MTEWRYRFGLFTLQFLIADAAEKTEITLFTSSKSIGTVQAVIMRRNLLLNRNEASNSI